MGIEVMKASRSEAARDVPTGNERKIYLGSQTMKCPRYQFKNADEDTFCEKRVLLAYTGFVMQVSI